MQSRVYDLAVSVTASAQPAAATPSGSSDLVPLSFFGTIVEQEAVSGTVNGSNTGFTVAHTPLSTWPFSLFMDGIKLILGTDYTRGGSAITMITAPKSGQVLTADYRY